MKDIANRNDVHLLVSKFYIKVRKEPVLGPIFNRAIQDWPAHLNHITDFWETSLLMVNNYDGNPVTAHQKLDQAENHTIEMYHFGLWINLWKETVYELYKGEIADLAIRRAKNMASILFIKMFEARS
ncbi:group III truncated hemoglobin [Nonlabens dokdonensis]|uniref:Globin n=1 Tax=Nonlabens dokdonensis (strain DSM 17205 / KCTC 12402 / DSW-6) TaxID=592029 RepID=L7W8Q6_NONDD|nr:group III truncated hemoglobin [Nonlabens dokdonensis]AGC76196.1 uncharacterized protein DDD_1069 [Nonlabens dokdonensis DSW-6]